MAVLYAAVCAFLVLQVVPLGEVVSLDWRDASGQGWKSQTISLSPGDTWLMLLQMLCYGATFYLFAQLSANRERARLVLWTIGIIVAAYALVGLVSLTQLGDTYLGLPKSAYLGSATATFVNRNSYATFLCCGLVVASAFLVEAMAARSSSADRFAKVGAPAGIVLIVGIALLATNSRMGVFAGIIGTAVVLLFGAVKARLKTQWWMIIVPAVLVCVAAVGTQWGTGVLERVVSVENAADERGLIYSQVWDMIRARPFWGFGGGAFDSAFPMFHRPPLTSGGRIDKAHSTYLALWAELGLVFGSIPLITVSAVAARAFSLFRRSASNWVIGLAAIGVIVVTAVHSTVDFSLEIQANAYLLSAILGLAAGADATRAATAPSVRR